MPPVKAKRHNPVTIKFRLLLGKRGINKNGKIPSRVIINGRLTCEPTRIPATQAQLT